MCAVYFLIRSTKTAFLDLIEHGGFGCLIRRVLVAVGRGAVVEFASCAGMRIQFEVFGLR